MSARRNIGRLAVRAVGALRSARRAATGGGALRILLFHEVPMAEREAFRVLIGYLARRYRFVAPERLGAVLDGKERPRGIEVLLTFDDGFRSNLWAAREVLRPLGITALFFVPSRFPDCADRDEERQFIADRIFDRRLRAGDVPDDMAPMAWADLARLREDGHVIGSHSATHARLSTLIDRAALEAEIVGSGARIAEKLGTAVEHFAYPFGDIGGITNGVLRLASKHYGFVHSGIRGPNSAGTPPGAVRRDAFRTGDSPWYVGAVLGGGLDWYYRGRAARLDAMARP